VIFFVVMFIYSTKLTLVVLGSIPVYLIVAGLIRPLLRERINEKFNAAPARSSSWSNRSSARRRSRPPASSR
jgi:ABC-type bacteriocin/lantibiotic exporter with double-glycine peptidase domain